VAFQGIGIHSSTQTSLPVLTKLYTKVLATNIFEAFMNKAGLHASSSKEENYSAHLLSQHP
jgi:hypothetical protein